MRLIFRNFSAMRIKIRLDGRKNVLTTKGFPIIIYITGFKSSENKKDHVINTGYHSKESHWDGANALPKKNHPDYVNLLNYLERKKIIIARLLSSEKLDPISIGEAEKLITQNDSDVFYEVALEFCKNRVYKTALNSFQSYCPDYTFSMINKKVVKNYMEALLVTPTPSGERRSPNGVYSYMDKLTSLWNFCGRGENPFKKIRPEQIESRNKALNTEDLIKVRDNTYKLHSNSRGGGKKEYLDYFMLGFYLGGIDLGDLRLFRYDRNIVGGRIEFYRAKGSSKKVFVSNFIFPEAAEILERYKKQSYPYLIPLEKNLNYDNYTANMSREYEKMRKKLGLTRKPFSKSARYSFINRAQNMLIDERIAKAIVGHSEGSSSHSIYKDAFPQRIKDKAHKKIIDLSIDAEHYEPEF